MSPGEITKKTNLLMPSLMSPEPASRLGKPSRDEEALNGKKAEEDKERSRRRSKSAPRNKTYRSRSKTSRKVQVDKGLAISKTNSSTKPNYLLSYSSRSGIAPEGQQLTFSLNKPGLSDYLDKNQRLAMPAPCLSFLQRQSGMVSPEARQLPHEQNSLPGYKNRAGSFTQAQNTYTLPAGRIGRYETHVDRSALNQRSTYQYTPQSTSQYAMSRNVDSMALPYHTTFGERIAQASSSAHYHPASAFSGAATMHTPLPLSSSSLGGAYSSAGLVQQEHQYDTMPQTRVRFQNPTERDLQYSTSYRQDSRHDSSFRHINIGF